ncbi:MAG: DUF6077 domain-containing protein [bacterium]|nr:DUF6077 domain-containing protein [bacterium]MCM1374834.1 DUF6077 domain-containing protein [Muribaculum sp.]
MIILLWLALALLPWLLGAGMLIVLNRKSAAPIHMTDAWIMGAMCCVVVAEPLHLVGVFARVSLGRLLLIWHGIMVVLGVVALVLAVRTYRMHRERFRILPERGGSFALPGSFLLLVLIQAVYLYCMPALGVSGDIMVETVCSFQASDGIYQVNPLTGQAFVQGLSMRYQILGLPTLYTFLAASFGVEGALFVWNLIPVVVLAGTYMVYYRIARLLFGDDLRRKYLFLIIVALIFWCGEGAPWLDGYAALHSAWTGSSIRNLILLPYALSLGLERDLRHTWPEMALCVLTEACVCRTFNGLGLCLLLLVLLLLLDRLWSIKRLREGRS